MSVQLKKYTKFGILQWIRFVKLKTQKANLGKQIWIDKNVQFMRHPENIAIGSNVIIKEGVKICPCNVNAKIVIGSRTTLGYHTLIFASESIEIGNDCMIAPFVYLVDSDHSKARNKLMNQQGNITERIKIGNDVWLASNVTILKGVEIGEGAIIASNSVVNKNVGPYEIWAGIPAKKIGNRE